MNIRLQVLIIVGIVCFFLCIGNLLKKKEIDFKYAIGWIMLGLAVMVLALFPKLLNWISSQVGIESPVNMLFFFGFCLSICMLFVLSISLSHANDKIKKLAQEIAILRRTIHEDKQQ